MTNIFCCQMELRCINRINLTSSILPLTEVVLQIFFMYVDAQFSVIFKEKNR